MHCPYCAEIDTKVSDSRLTDNGGKVRRRRICPGCDYKFTTYESVDLTMPRIIKSDDSMQNFDVDKISNGILRSTEKRPISSVQIDKAISNIKQNLIGSGEKEISSKQVGEWVLHELKQLDEVAYVRFASVYKSFQDVSDFINMIEKLEKGTLQELQKNQVQLFPSKGIS